MGFAHMKQTTQTESKRGLVSQIDLFQIYLHPNNGWATEKELLVLTAVIHHLDICQVHQKTS